MQCVNTSIHCWQNCNSFGFCGWMLIMYILLTTSYCFVWFGQMYFYPAYFAVKTCPVHHKLFNGNTNIFPILWIMYSSKEFIICFHLSRVWFAWPIYFEKVNWNYEIKGLFQRTIKNQFWLAFLIFAPYTTLIHGVSKKKVGLVN